MEFKDRIKILINEKGITPTQLASEFGKTDSAIRMWTIGRTKPDVDTLIKLAKYFDCTTDYLLGLSNYRDAEFEKIVHKEFSSLEDALFSIYDDEIRSLCVDVLKKVINTSNSLSATFSNDLGFLLMYIRISILLAKAGFNVVDYFIESSQGNKPSKKEYCDEIFLDMSNCMSRVSSLLDRLISKIDNDYFEQDSITSQLDVLSHFYKTGDEDE